MLSTENAIAYSERGKARNSWDGSRLTFFSLGKIDNAANFTLKKVSVLTIVCTHTGFDTLHGGKLIFLRK